MSEEFTRDKINAETARLNWHDLQTFFAAGTVVAVTDGLDLVEVGYQMSQNNEAQLGDWMSSGKVGLVTDQQATAWYELNRELWAVVIKPFVLVQETREDS